MRLKIWTPRSARPRFYCRVALGDGTQCGHPFYESERRAYEQHVAKCANDHADEGLATIAEGRPSGFFQPFDPEYAAWVKREGRPG